MLFLSTVIQSMVRPRGARDKRDKRDRRNTLPMRADTRLEKGAFPAQRCA